MNGLESISFSHLMHVIKLILLKKYKCADKKDKHKDILGAVYIFFTQSNIFLML